MSRPTRQIITLDLCNVSVRDAHESVTLHPLRAVDQDWMNFILVSCTARSRLDNFATTPLNLFGSFELKHLKLKLHPYIYIPLPTIHIGLYILHISVHALI